MRKGHVSWPGERRADVLGVLERVQLIDDDDDDAVGCRVCAAWDSGRLDIDAGELHGLDVPGHYDDVHDGWRCHRADDDEHD
jgi:hypothetical protein